MQWIVNMYFCWFGNPDGKREDECLSLGFEEGQI